MESVVRGKSKHHSIEDRELVVMTARKGRDWMSMLDVLGIKKTTAEAWIRSGTPVPRPKKCRRKKLTEARMEMVIEWLEQEHGRRPNLGNISDRIYNELGITINRTTISRRLHGKLIEVKKWRDDDRLPMNSPENKLKRKEHVEKLLQYMEEGGI